MTATFLEMKGISKSFAGVVALKGVDLELEAGEVHALLGENGAGKSTLMKILSGLTCRDAGTIRLEGRPVEIRYPHEAIRLGISMIHQELNLVPSLSVGENVFLGQLGRFSLGGFLDWKRLWGEARGLLKSLDLDLDPSSPVSRLGVAHRQMVEIAKALSFESRILIMDEPTASLSDHEVGTLFRVISDLKRRGAAIVYISHRLEELERVADRVTVLRDGEKVETVPRTSATAKKLILLMAGRTLTQRFPPREVSPGPCRTILKVKQLSLKGHFKDVSFELKSGEILGLAGLVGAGRTSLVRSLFGLERPDGGSVQAPAMGFLPEDRRRQGLFLNLSTRENVVAALLARGSLSRWAVLDRKGIAALARGWVRDLGIKPSDPERPVRGLSGGNQQKAVLARWLGVSPEVLIFDEPTRGVDVVSKFEIYQWMRRLAREGAGILMVSSELPEVLGLSDRILVMRRGRLAGELAAEDATQEKVLELAF